MELRDRDREALDRFIELWRADGKTVTEEVLYAFMETILKREDEELFGALIDRTNEVILGESVWRYFLSSDDGSFFEDLEESDRKLLRTTVANWTEEEREKERRDSHKTLPHGYAGYCGG